MTRSTTPSGGVRGWFREHPKVMNLVVIAVYLLAMLSALEAAFDDVGADAVWIVVFVVITAGVLLLRLRLPLAVTAVVAAGEVGILYLCPWFMPTQVGLWFALYAVGRTRGLVWGLVAAVLTSSLVQALVLRVDSWTTVHGGPARIELVIGDGIRREDLSQLLIQSAIALVLAACVAAAIGAAVRHGREHEQDILRWAEHSRELAQIGERNRIAREMHDVVAHSLSVMISLADGAKVVVRRDADRAAEVMGEVSSTGRTALADMRRVIGVLRAGDDVEEARRSVQGSLTELFDGFRQAGLPLAVTTKGPPLPDDQAFVLTVHRILQESLTNVLRYGRQVSEVEVVVEHLPGPSAQEQEQMSQEGLSAQDQRALGMSPTGQVTLTVTDDGVLSDTPAPSVGSGQGICGMGERAAFYRGSVYAGPGRRRGWMVHAVLEPPETSRTDSGSAHHQARIWRRDRDE